MDDMIEWNVLVIVRYLLMQNLAVCTMFIKSINFSHLIDIPLYHIALMGGPTFPARKLVAPPQTLKLSCLDWTILTAYERRTPLRQEKLSSD